MSMSRKDFIALADALRPMVSGDPWTAEQLLSRVADFCHGQNPEFNRGRWMGYIKGENGPHGKRPKRCKHDFVSCEFCGVGV